jgi:hypothetical protein
MGVPLALRLLSSLENELSDFGLEDQLRWEVKSAGATGEAVLQFDDLRELSVAELVVLDMSVRDIYPLAKSAHLSSMGKEGCVYSFKRLCIWSTAHTFCIGCSGLLYVCVFR